MDVLLRRFLRAGIRRGLGGNWYWFLLAGATFMLRRVLNDRGGAVSTVTVAPGEQVLITVRDRGDAPHPRRCPLPTTDAGAGPPRGGGARAPHRPQGPPLPRHAGAGATFHTHAGVLAHDDIIGATEGCTVTGSTGRTLPRPAAHAERRRAQDATRRAGHLPQGPRRHPHRRRHRTRAACPRGRRGLGRPVDDGVARRRVRHRLRAA